MYNITKGNVVPMKATLVHEEERFPVAISTDISVRIYNEYRYIDAINIVVDGEEDGVIYFDIPDTLNSGTFGVEVKGKSKGYNWRTATDNVVKITRSTEKEEGSEAIPEGDTYDIVMTVQLYKQQSPQEAIDEHNNDEEAHPYILDKINEVEGKIPVLPDHIVTDENYVHTDNNYTNEEKEKLANLENYDDSGIRQELDGKVDKVQGKGLSTNDFTNEDKAKLNSALQSETDPTVPQWAKQPNKPTYSAQEVGALPNSTKYGSTIDLTMDSATYVLTLSLKDQDGTVLNTKTVDLPIESVVVNGRYDATNKKIVLTLQSGSTIDVPVGDLVAGLQTEITSVNMLSADLVDDTNSAHKFVTAQEKQNWNNKSDFSGDYNDLANKPTIPTVPTNVSAFANDAGYLTEHQDISGKVDKEQGKGLSTNDYTTQEKNKLASLENYDDTQVRQLIAQTDAKFANYYTKSEVNTALSNTVAESGVYDVTANNSGATFASLSALLSAQNLDTLIPVAKRKGGMSIKFVCTSDNMYVQYRLMADSFSISIADWMEEKQNVVLIKHFVESSLRKYEDWSVGDYGYSISTKSLRVITNVTDGYVNTSSIVPLGRGIVYIYNNEYYSWNGDKLILGINKERFREFTESKSLLVLNGTFDENFNTVLASNRLCTGLIKCIETTNINVASGYQLKVRVLDSPIHLVSSTDWITSYQMLSADDRYYILIVRKTNNSEINSTEFATAIVADFSNCSFYLQCDLINLLQDNIDDVKGNIDDVKGNIGNYTKTKNLQIENCGMQNTQNVVVSSTYITSGLIQFASNRTLTANSDYLFAVREFDENLNMLFAPTIFVSSYDFVAGTFYMLVIKKEDNSAIQASDFSNAISGNFTGCKYYLSADIVSSILTYNSSEIKRIDTEVNNLNKSINNFYLNRNLVGLNDMTWEYQNWVFPQIISYKGVRDNLYFTFTNDGGFSGIAQYNYVTKEVTKTFLKKGTVDDHNLIAVIMRDDNKLLCSFSGGHDTDNNIYIRIADARESIESFGEPIVLECSTTTTYSQLFKYDGKIYLFYRLHGSKWAYRISNDDGLTWTNEVIFIKSSVQFYCQFTETLTDGVLRMISYSNPNYNDTSIRMGFVHLDNMTLYDTDNQTVIGTTNIDKDNIRIIVPKPTGKKIRMYNSAKSAINDTKVLYCTFGTASDGEYMVYDNGNSYKVADSGLPTWGNYVQNGIAWIGVNQIAVARESQGVDYIEIYDYTNGISTLNRVVASGRRTEYNAVYRPMIDDNQKAMVYLTGIYGDYYTDFRTDGTIEEL